MPCCYHWSLFKEGREHTMECEGVNLHGLEHRILWNPDSPEAWPSDATFVAQGETPEDVPWSCLWPLVSDRVRFLIESNGLSGATFWPVRMESYLPVPIPRYWYVHFHHLRDAIDYERATWRRMTMEKLPPGMTEQPIMMIKYVLRGEAVEGWDLFRCTEHSSPIFCSERFRELFMENECTGLNFLPVPVSD